mmetsp:Transcript_16353/g.42851  ORF Transcript_16353/g.42851 Transcript_16353/m.42851 type:complete len:88 (+) Transcript_16353:403-666(+)
MGAALRSPALLDNPAFVGVLSTFVGAISNLVGVAKEAADRLYLGNLPEAVAVIVANLVLAGFYVSVMTVLMLSAEGAMGEVQKGVLV